MPTVAMAIASAALLLGASRQRIVRAIPHPSGPTYSKEVSRIFQAHCDSCHHPGDIAPFSLMTYADAQPHAAMIKLMTQTRQMPPWKPAADCGELAETRTISQDEIDTIARWVNAGTPEGDPADLPPPLDFSSGWTLGQPDLVLSYPQPYLPPAEGDIYRCLPLPTNLTSDQYVSAIDVHPGDRKTVHHVIAFIDTTGASQKLDDDDPAPGYTCFGGPGFSITDSSTATLGGWVPGSVATRFPEEVALSLPADSRVVLQVHYHSHDGSPSPDTTQIGIYFAKKKPQKLLRVLPLMNTTFTIPPNDSDYSVTASLTAPISVHLWAIAPHMHLLGRTMDVEAALPAGRTQCLIRINDWDFNWQGLYRFKEPIAIPALTRFSLQATFDNSENNPRNPNAPPKAVSWGEQTTDEMCIAFIAFTVDFENLETTGKVDANWW
ncbi:MAG TPA: ascorbate-dependent monooxygenase [Thermoanaerobaculia bacterium]|nr:ascorbate-dependent monooxygenase [Thermoanaerobaculia bacterium]